MPPLAAARFPVLFGRHSSEPVAGSHSPGPLAGVPRVACDSGSPSPTLDARAVLPPHADCPLCSEPRSSIPFRRARMETRAVPFGPFQSVWVGGSSTGCLVTSAQPPPTTTARAPNVRCSARTAARARYFIDPRRSLGQSPSPRCFPPPPLSLTIPHTDGSRRSAGPRPHRGTASPP